MYNGDKLELKKSHYNLAHHSKSHVASPSKTVSHILHTTKANSLCFHHQIYNVHSTNSTKEPLSLSQIAIFLYTSSSTEMEMASNIFGK